jgi:PAS domain S-box-containing protein
MHRWILRPIWRKLSAFAKRVMNALEGAETIRAELRPNGGGSFRDHLDRQFAIVNNRLSTNEARSAMTVAFQRQTVGTDPKVAIVELSAAGKVIWANARMMEITGLSLDDIRAGLLSSVIHEDDREEVLERWAHAVDGTRPFLDTFRYSHAVTEKPVVVRAHVSPVLVNEAVIGWVGVITELPKRTKITKVK